MALTPSTMQALGTSCPEFSLPDVTTGGVKSLADFSGDELLLVMFICRHCPYVVHVQGELARIARDYSGKGVAFAAVSSNDAENYPDDAPENLRLQAREQGFPFPYLYDEDQSAARAFSAACTPDFFLYDKSRRRIYRGQMDDSRPGNGKPVTGKDLRAALDAALDARPVPADQRPSVGCGIKWK